MTHGFISIKDCDVNHQVLSGTFRISVENDDWDWRPAAWIQFQTLLLFFFIQMYVQSTAVVCFNCPNRGQSKKVLLRQPYLILFICITHCTPVLPIFSTSATSNGGSSIFSFDLFSLLKLETCLCLTHTSLLLIRQIFNARPWLWSKCSPTCNLLWSLHVLSSQALCGNKVILWCWSKVRYSWMMEFVHLEVFCCHLIIYPFLLFTKAFRWCCLLSVFLFNSIIEKKIVWGFTKTCK